jgi:hypothetical protein
MLFIFCKKRKKVEKVFDLYLYKDGFDFENFFTKMISAKNSANAESFNRFGGGRRKDWRFPMDTPI